MCVGGWRETRPMDVKEMAEGEDPHWVGGATDGVRDLDRAAQVMSERARDTAPLAPTTTLGWIATTLGWIALLSLALLIVVAVSDASLAATLPA